jgi:hypothetical protein
MLQHAQSRYDISARPGEARPTKISSLPLFAVFEFEQASESDGRWWCMTVAEPGAGRVVRCGGALAAAMPVGGLLPAVVAAP